jgi:Universal stress protein family
MSPVTKISRVLVGVDFDDASASALKMAGALASAWGAEITVFHAATLEEPAYFTGAQIVALQAERERSRAAIAARLHALADQHVPRTVRVVSRPDVTTVPPPGSTCSGPHSGAGWFGRRRSTNVHRIASRTRI